MSAVTNQSASSDPVSALHHLVLIFEDCPDFRADNDNKAHLLSDIIVIALCAVMGGANFWTSVERFGKGHEAWFRTFLTLENGIPSHDTFQRVFAHLDPEALNSRFGRWMAEICGGLKLKHIAIDGKTMCGSADEKGRLKGLHVVHAFATANGV